MNTKNTTKFIEALNEGADQLDSLNKQFPELASDFTIETVEEFRHHAIELAQDCSEPEKHLAAEDNKLVDTIRELLAIHSFEDVLDILETEHGTTLDMVQLVNIIGNNAYITALRLEAHKFQSNAISLKQIAQLWKDFGRPPLGDTSWTAKNVSLLLE